jgi:hypothetical protein
VNSERRHRGVVGKLLVGLGDETIGDGFRVSGLEVEVSCSCCLESEERACEVISSCCGGFGSPGGVVG